MTEQPTSVQVADALTLFASRQVQTPPPKRIIVPADEIAALRRQRFLMGVALATVSVMALVAVARAG